MTAPVSTSAPEDVAQPGVRRASIGHAVRSVIPTLGAIGLLVALAAHRYLPLVNADALVPALISTQHLTFFYWGQDRLASLVPALAWPVRDSIWNFRVQMLIAGFAFFGLIAMFVWFHMHATGQRATSGVLALASLVSGLLAMAPMRAIAGYRFIFEQGYALSLVLFLAGGRWLMRPYSRRTLYPHLAGGLVVLASLLVNPSLALLTPAFWILDDDREGRLRRLAAGAGIVAAGFVVGAVAARVLYDGQSYRSEYNDFSVARARHGLHAAVSGVLGSIQLSVAMVIGIACVVALASRWRAFPLRLRVAYLGAPLVGLAWLVVFSGNLWVERNLYEFRYFYTLYAAGMLILAASVTEAILLARGRLSTQRWLSAPRPTALGVLCTVAVVLVVAIPLYAAAHTDIPTLDATEHSVAAARRFDAEFVVGDYWNTWPIVVAGRGAGLDLLGVTYRSDAIDDEIHDAVDDSLARTGAVRVLCTSGDAVACTNDFAAFTGGDWVAAPAANAQPLVIDIRPAP